MQPPVSPKASKPPTTLSYTRLRMKFWKLKMHLEAYRVVDDKIKMLYNEIEKEESCS